MPSRQQRTAPPTDPSGAHRSVPIKVLIVDDSAVVRQVLTELLTSDPDIEVIGTAHDPVIASDKLRRIRPDVITLDIEMPRMDGITFLRQLMAEDPLPVVMCSSVTEKGAELAMRALQYGAVDVINKPRLRAGEFPEETRLQICEAVKAAARARVRRLAPLVLDPLPKLTADVILDRPRHEEPFRATDKIVAVGASTGGTEALRRFLQALPGDAPGIVIVQHMPREFTAAFARRLDGLCRVAVKEAAEGDTLVPGRALIAPGNRHLLVRRSGTRYYAHLKDGPLVCRHRPSVDVLFRSVARCAGLNAIGVIMTGMGDDGARGMLEMKQTGAGTLAQDEESCVVFGMPMEAIKRGGVDRVLPLEQLADEVMRLYRAGN